MYAFSPLFGILADKIGKLQTVLVGQTIYIAALCFAGFGMDDHNFVLLGLFLLGLGWSASTVSASSLLSASLPTEEKSNVQGLSDTMMNLSGAFGGAISGTIMAALMFVGLNMAALVPVSIILGLSAIALLRSKPKQGETL
jgi:MFS family permease